jgi:hypothetical protein
MALWQSGRYPAPQYATGPVPRPPLARHRNTAMRAAVWALAIAVLLPPALLAPAVSAQPRPDAPAEAAPTAPARPAEREAVVANELGLTIRELYAAPATQPDPGPDRLGADTLPPGGTVRLRLGRNQPCGWNLRAVLADDTVQERRNIDLCRTTRVTFGDPSLPLREVTVLNDGDMTVRELFVSAPSSASGSAPRSAPGSAPGSTPGSAPGSASGAARGPDRLGAEVIAPGRTFRLRLGRTRDCTFDVVAVLEDGSELVRRNLDLCRTPRLALADPAVPWRDATVLNRAGRPIAALNAVPAGRAPPGPAPTGDATPEAWGPERLPEALAATGLADGARVRFRLRLPTCAADLRVTYADGRREEKRGVDVCRDAVTFDGSGIPRPVQRPLTLVNRHGAVLEEIYVSSSTDGEWGPERLPGGLARGARETLSLPVECAVDLRVVFPNGAAEERREVDICRVATVVVRAGWTLAARLDEGEVDRGEGPTPGAVRLRNAARVPIVELYLDPPGAAARGADRLGATVLGLNETLDLAPSEPGACAVRLTAVFRDGREVVREPFDLCSGTEIALP